MEEDELRAWRDKRVTSVKLPDDSGPLGKVLDSSEVQHILWDADIGFSLQMINQLGASGMLRCRKLHGGNFIYDRDAIQSFVIKWHATVGTQDERHDEPNSKKKKGRR